MIHFFKFFQKHTHHIQKVVDTLQDNLIETFVSPKVQGTRWKRNLDKLLTVPGRVRISSIVRSLKSNIGADLIGTCDISCY